MHDDQEPESVGAASGLVSPRNVQWRCVRCTNSCGDTASHKRRILLLEDDTRRIEGLTGMNRHEFSFESNIGYPYEREMRKDDNGKCVFLKKGLCSIYEVRPLICQFYPFSLKQDLKGKLTFEVDAACTGIRDSSPLVGTEHFAALLETARDAFRRNNQLKGLLGVK